MLVEAMQPAVQRGFRFGVGGQGQGQGIGEQRIKPGDGRGKPVPGRSPLFWQSWKTIERRAQFLGIQQMRRERVKAVGEHLRRQPAGSVGRRGQQGIVASGEQPRHLLQPSPQRRFELNIEQLPAQAILGKIRQRLAEPGSRQK